MSDSTRVSECNKTFLGIETISYHRPPAGLTAGEWLSERRGYL